MVVGRALAHIAHPRTVYLGIFLVCAIVVLMDTFRSPIRSDTIAPSSELAATFSLVVFENDLDGHPGTYRIEKWAGPVKVVMVGEYTDWHRTKVDELISLLRRLTGLTIETTNLNDVTANSMFIFADDPAVIDEYGLRFGVKNLGKHWKDTKHQCVALTLPNSTRRITRQISVIARKKQDDQTTRCVAEEFVHGFGTKSDRATYHPSIFSNEWGPIGLTLNDRVIIRTLYDARLYPAMPRDRAMPIAEKVITELVDAVKERGEEALYQR